MEIANLGRIKAQRLDGSETFRSEGRALPFNVLQFWRWSVSDLVSNATRGVLAEFIVANALGVDTSTVRDEWAAYDLDMPPGIKVEVKSCAYLQSWAQKRPSPIVFSIRPARTWDPDSNQLAPQPSRAADVYVFALLSHLDKVTLDPLNLDQWEFYVLPTAVLNERKRSQHSITLRSLKAMKSGPFSFHQLRRAVLKCSTEVPNQASQSLPEGVPAP